MFRKFRVEDSPVITVAGNRPRNVPIYLNLMYISVLIQLNASNLILIYEDSRVRLLVLGNSERFRVCRGFAEYLMMMSRINSKKEQ